MNYTRTIHDLEQQCARYKTALTALRNLVQAEDGSPTVTAAPAKTTRRRRKTGAHRGPGNFSKRTKAQRARMAEIARASWAARRAAR